VTIFGPDIANFQAGLNLAQVKAEGFDFVFCKVSEGNYFQDRTWPGFRDAARANGLLLAGYHYVRGDNTPDSQADTFVQQLGDNSIPAMLDFEANGGNIDQFWAVLNAIQARGVHVALSYIPRWYWQQIGSPNIAAVPGLIQSSYVSGSGVASALYPGDQAGNWAGFGGRNVDILQFTDAASIAGKAVDCNAFRGTRDQLAALLGGATPAVITQEDDMAVTPSFEPDVRGSLAAISKEVAGLSQLNRDLRGDLAQKTAQIARLEALLSWGVGRDPAANPPTFDGVPWVGSPRQIATAALMAAETAAARAADCSRKLDAILAAPAGVPGAAPDVTAALKSALATLTMKAST
jgi:lysozyme